MSRQVVFRPTSVQIVARSLLRSIGFTAVALVPSTAIVAWQVPQLWWILPAVPVVVMLATFTMSVRMAMRSGVIADDTGIRPNAHDPEVVKRYAPWPMITDIRAERWRGRTVPVIYLNDGAQPPWRLNAPYSGAFLAADPELDEKIFILRSMWDSYRHDRPPDWGKDNEYN